jgi:hypothetical protein
MTEVPETTWAYLAGLIDGEGYLDVFLHSNPSYRRQMKKGYARQFSLYIANNSRELLENVQKNIGNLGTITKHNYSPATRKRAEEKGRRYTSDLHTLRFYANNLRIILPKVIPYLILKKQPAEIMLKMLGMVGIHNAEQRERTLLLMHKQFHEACVKTAGNKYRKNRKQDAIIERMMGRDGKLKLDSFA